MIEYELPEPYHFGLTKEHAWLSITPAQFDKLKPMYRMSSHSHETLMEEVAKAEQRGREAMRDECLAICANTPCYPFRPALEVAHEIRKLK